MKNIIKSMVLASTLAFAPVYAKETERTITLDKGNHLALVGEINEKSSSEFIYKLLTLNKDNVLVYVSSPGGSVVSGMKIIQVAKDLKAKNSNLKITCHVDFAASMAFAITQTICDERLIGDSSTLMQHQATFGVQGREGEVSSRISMILSILEVMDKMQAKRLNTSVSEFRKKSRDEWWLIGQNAIDNKAADEIVPIVCTKELTLDTKKQQINLFGLTAELTWSQCPLVTYPLKISIEGQNISREQREKIEKEIYESIDIRKSKFTVSP